jgi:hypothetical protein
MIRGRMATPGVVLGVAMGFVLAAPVTQARADGWLRWQSGQVLVYRGEHDIQVSETVGTEKSGSKSRLSVTKRWQVMDVDAAGVATIQLTLLRLRNEITRPDGETIVFDSADPKSPESKEQIARYVGPVLAVLRVDPWGKVVEVKESKFGPPSRFESELPFVVVMPPSGPLKEGRTWDRAYQITLDPPQGTGEKFAAVQHYRFEAIAGSLVTIKLTTELKALPEAPGDRVPLAQSQPAGEVVFDVRAGRLHSASLKVDQEVKGHQGEGSSYHFQSSYTEQYAGER